jgi:hypothetical protein
MDAAEIEYICQGCLGVVDISVGHVRGPKTYWHWECFRKMTKKEFKNA